MTERPHHHHYFAPGTLVRASRRRLRRRAWLRAWLHAWLPALLLLALLGLALLADGALRGTGWLGAALWGAVR